MRILKTNTAVRIVVGPLVSYSDGYTLKTGLTVTGIEVNMWHEHDDGSAPAASIDGVNPTASGGSNDMVELAHGYYDLEITAAQCNFLGRAKFMMFDADQFLPYFEDWLVVPANVFDSLVGGTDTLQADVTQLLGTAWLTPGTAGTPDVNAKLIGGTAQTGNDIGADCNTIVSELANGTYGLSALETLVDGIESTLGAAGAGLTAVPWNAAWDAEVQSECTDALNAYDPPTKAELDTAQGAVTVASIGSGVITAAAIATGAIDADALASDAVDEIWDRASTLTLSFETLLTRVYQILNNKMVITESDGSLALRNIGDTADIATGDVEDLGATTRRDELTWT